VLERIADTPISELEQFLPDVWTREHGKASGGQSAPTDGQADV
jgi:hypothetical protein